MFKKILVPIDGSDSAQKAAAVAKNIAEKHGSQEVILLHVLPLPPVLSEDYIAISSGSIKIPGIEEFELFKIAEEIFNDTKVTVNMRLERGDASSNIVIIATQEQVDLIVIGSRGLGGLKSFLLGSVSKEVVNDAPCAVLVVK